MQMPELLTLHLLDKMVKVFGLQLEVPHESCMIILSDILTP